MMGGVWEPGKWGQLPDPTGQSLSHGAGDLDRLTWQAAGTCPRLEPALDPSGAPITQYPTHHVERRIRTSNPTMQVMKSATSSARGAARSRSAARAPVMMRRAHTMGRDVDSFSGM